MARYTGTWTFMNVMHPKHRESDTATVEADDEDAAKWRIRQRGADRLFGGGMLIYFNASNVRKIA